MIHLGPRQNAASRPAAVEFVRDKWDADRVVPENMTAEQAACPFGQSVGAWIAWKFANAMKVYRMGIL